MEWKQGIGKVGSESIAAVKAESKVTSKIVCSDKKRWILNEVNLFNASNGARTETKD